MEPRKTLLIGLDGADWETLLPMLDAGALPNLEMLVERGVIGKLRGIRPSLSAMHWTSVATGVRPDVHGVTGVAEPHETGIGIRRFGSGGRRRKAIWNILQQCGMRCHVIGWPATAPTEPLDGVVVGDGFADGVPGDARRWDLPGACVWPERLMRELGELRVHPSEITVDDLRPLIPKIENVDPRNRHRVGDVVRILGRSASFHAAATASLQLEDWDFAAVRYGGIAEACERFLEFHPPKLDWVSDHNFELFRGVIEGMYRFHDLMLGVLIGIAGDDATVMVVSGQGEESGQGRASPGKFGRNDKDYGVLLMSGPGIKRDELLYGSSVLDVLPTVLHLHGVAVGRDLAGKVLRDAFEDSQQRGGETIESWEGDVAGDGMLPTWKRWDPITREAMFDHLSNAGILTDAFSRDAEAADCLVELRYCLAQTYVAAGRGEDAIPLLESLWEEHPEESRYASSLMTCYLEAGGVENSRAAFERMLANKKRFAVEAGAAYLNLKREMGELDERDYPPDLRRQVQKLWKQSRTNLSAMAFFRGWLLRLEGKPEEALSVLDQVDEGKVFNVVSLLNLKAETNFELGRFGAATELFQRVLELEPENVEACLGISRVCFKTNCFPDAVRWAEEAISLRYWNPKAHFLKGTAIYRAGDARGAIEPLETVVAQAPGMAEAHERLSLLYRDVIKDAETAVKHRAMAKEARAGGSPGVASERPVSEMRSVVDYRKLLERWERIVEEERCDGGPWSGAIVVTGVSGSGISLMIDSLRNAGVPVNGGKFVGPDGVLKGRRRDLVNLGEGGVADAGVAGIPLPLVGYLPDRFACRVILMIRPLKTVLKVQREQGCTPEAVRRDYGLSEDVIVDAYRHELLGQLERFAWLREQGVDVGLLPVKYDELVADPEGVMGEVLGWLGVSGGR